MMKGKMPKKGEKMPKKGMMEEKGKGAMKGAKPPMKFANGGKAMKKGKC